MSNEAKHTQDRLCVTGMHTVKDAPDSRAFSLETPGGLCVAAVIFNPSAGDDAEVCRADALRLAYCWNDVMEREGKPDHELAAERAKVKRLREALQGWLAWVDRPTLDADDPLRRITYKAHESRIDASRAALAETAE